MQRQLNTGTDPSTSIHDIMIDVSRHADLVIMGMRAPRDDEDGDFIEHVGGFIEPLGTVLLVRASRHFEGTNLLFDTE